ncbi:MAG: helix-turn-helix domain-containing protein [Lachnospiraceae bacterium]|nr:helix-turn-helix domain-containing protein [Lachnospiraceae bacterium]
MAKDLDTSLSELEHLTGLSLRLEGLNGENEAEAQKKVAMLVSAYRDKYDRTNFIRRMLTGEIGGNDLYLWAAHFHIADKVRREVYVVDVDSSDTETVLTILKQMFVTNGGDVVASVDGHKTVLIKVLTARESRESIDKRAKVLVDTLNTEAMVKARVGLGHPTESVGELQEAYQEACTCLAIGSIFYHGQTLFTYDKLGIGRLIYRLPNDVCKSFLHEVCKDFDITTLDDESVSIINAFFENNLNISETARHLYVHRNTLVYRFEKLKALTGVDLRNFDEAMELKVAMMVADYLKTKE